jgi:hypothetical protein
MFDPTVYDNLKVAFENQVYDLDNLTGQIEITGRLDRLELSVMAREFAIQFSLKQKKEKMEKDTGTAMNTEAEQKITAEIRLESSLKELAAEIMEIPGEIPGCTLSIQFMMRVTDVSAQCRRIEEVLQDIWEPELPPVQSLSFLFGQEPVVYVNTVRLQFKRQINEEQMEDIPALLEHVLRSPACAQRGKMC